MKTALPPALTQARAQARAAWARLSGRERTAVGAAVAVTALAAVWWLLVAPAWSTLRAAPERHERLDAQLGHMQRLAAQAEGLRAEASTAPGRDQTLKTLEAATQSLGAQAQIAVLGDRATLTLRGARPEGVAAWLVQVRQNARLVPVESQLTRDAEGGWSGTVIVAGPGLGGV